MYPRMEREFDRMVKKATPYLIFSPDAIRDSIADYMKSAWRAMRNNNINDFDLHCTNINDVIAKSDGQTEDALQIDISDFDRRYLSLDQSISELKKELLELKAAVRGKGNPSPVIEDGEKRKRGRPRKVKDEYSEPLLSASTSAPEPLLSASTSALEPPPETQYKPLQVGGRVYHTKYDIYLPQIPELLKYITDHGSITLSNIKDLFNINDKDAKGVLKLLQTRNLVKNEGKPHDKYSAKYVLRKDDTPCQ